MVGINILHNKYLNELKTYAEAYSIPIIQIDSIEYIKKYIKDNNIKSILEIGTAIGYSSICMALVNDKINIVSIEKDEKRYLQAIKNIKKFFLEDKITLIYSDALDVKLEQKFDLIFIDAAKSKYIDFFNHCKKQLKDNGTIITDNISFHDLIESKEEIKNKNLRKLVDKIKNYIDFLKNNNEFITEFINVGDGLAITRKKVSYD